MNHSITIDDNGTLMGEWASESDFRKSLPPIRTWREGKGSVIEELKSVFNDRVPSEIRPLLAAQYAIVRVLIDQDQYDLAKAVIQSAVIPAELESLRAQILAIIPPSDEI